MRGKGAGLVGLNNMKVGVGGRWWRDGGGDGGGKAVALPVSLFALPAGVRWAKYLGGSRGSQPHSTAHSGRPVRPCPSPPDLVTPLPSLP